MTSNWQNVSLIVKLFRNDQLDKTCVSLHSVFLPKGNQQPLNNQSIEATEEYSERML